MPTSEAKKRALRKYDAEKVEHNVFQTPKG